METENKNKEVNARKIDHFPLHLKPKWFGIKQEKEIGEPRKNSDLLKEEIKKPMPDEKKIDELTEKLVKGEEWQIEKPKEPLLILMRAGSSDTEIFEDVPVGQFKVKRSDGKEGTIILDQAKIRNIKWGKGSVNAWIASEEEAVTYPINLVFDNIRLVATMLAVLRSREKLDAKVWDARSNFALMAAVAIVIVIMGVAVIPPMFGVKLLKDNSVPANTVMIDTTNLTPEQAKELYEIKERIAEINNEKDLNKGGK